MKQISLIPLDLAIEKIVANVKPLKQTEMVSIFDANNRILAQDILATQNMPSFTNSAMDGYALRIKDIKNSLKIIAEIRAGDKPFSAKPAQNEAVKIMTGAIVPSAFDTVVPFEEALEKNNILKVEKEFKKGANIRQMGEEYKLSDVLLTKGTRLEMAQIATIAAQGISVVCVYAKPKIACISSGNELVEPWNVAQNHQIYNSNSIAIYTFLKSLNTLPSYINIAKDDKKSMEKTAKSLLKNFDMVIASGGVSVGNADFTQEAFSNAGLDIVFHGIATKPGKHGIFGTSKGAIFFGLPGNPLSSAAMMILLVKIAVLKLSGACEFYPSYSMAKLTQDLKFRGEKSHIIFGNLQNGEFTAHENYKYSSAMISAFAKSNAFLVTSKDKNAIKAGDLVKVISHSSKTMTNFFS